MSLKNGCLNQLHINYYSTFVRLLDLTNFNFNIFNELVFIGNSGTTFVTVIATYY